MDGLMPIKADLRVHMKLRHFRIIDTLATTKNLRLAAQHIGVTPTAISKACLELEDLVGVKLFHRSNNGMLPNTLCQRVVTAGRRIDSELKNLMYDLSVLNSSVQGRVRIGFQAPSLNREIAQCVADIIKNTPNIKISLEYGDRRQLITSMERNELDFILVNLSGLNHHDRLQSHMLKTDKCFVASIQSLHDMPEVIEKWDSFVEKPWVLPVQGLAMRDRFEALILAHGLEMPQTIVEMNSPMGAREIVALTGGYGLLTLSMHEQIGHVSNMPPNMRFLPEMELESGIVWAKDKNHSPVADFVRDYIMRTIRPEE
ncbi:LysR family transcriptional regulator [Acetobacter cibinongensis NRIC 0482]|nr:LysR family transcriptional regulator [Acetobacter cibinongensis NRIC 0482]